MDFKQPLFSHLGGVYCNFVEVKKISAWHSKRWHGGFVPTQVSLFYSGRIPSLAAVPYKAIREGTFQRQFNTIHAHLSSAFESTANSQTQHVAAQTQWIQLHHTFDAPAETEISKDGVSTTYFWGHISKLCPTCASQIHGINCHTDDFWVHGLHAWNTNLCPSWYKRNCHNCGNYKGFTKAVGKLNSGLTGEYRQPFTMLLSTYLALSFNDYDRHRSGRPAVFGWEGFITIP